MSQQVTLTKVFGHPFRLAVGMVCLVLFLNPVASELVYGAGCCGECSENCRPEDDSSEGTEAWVLQSSTERTRRPVRSAKPLAGHRIQVSSWVNPLRDACKWSIGHRKPTGHRWTDDLRAPLLN